MPIETGLNVLDDEIVKQHEEIIRTVLENTYKNADFSKGTVLYDLVVRPQAMYLALQSTNADNLRKSNSLLEISRNPELASEDIVDAVLSNFRVSRTPGNKASGSITIVMNNNTTTPIPSGSAFYSGTLRFVTRTSFVGVPSQALISRPTDRLIRKVGDFWEFIIEVEADDTGEQYQLTQGGTLTAEVPPPGYVKTYATYDFSPGSTAETNEELIQELARGAAGKTMSTRLNIESLLASEFPLLSHTSVVGYGDADMQRDRNNVFNIGYGGKSDIYVQSEIRPRIVRIRKPAMLMNVNTNTWTMSFGREEIPGVYKIARIVPVGGIPEGTDECGDPFPGSLKPTSVVRGFNKSPLSNGFAPTISRPEEAAFTSFQEISCQFNDPYTEYFSPVVGMMSDYDVDLLLMCDIFEMQLYVTDPVRSAFRYDDVVRPPIPCLVSCNMLVKASTGVHINTAAIGSAVANAINDTVFTNELSSAIIYQAAQDQLPRNARVMAPIDMLGEVIMPTDEISRVIRSSTVLRVPVDHSISMSERTVMFFANPDDIVTEIEYV